jgi:hypothetical protein
MITSETALAIAYAYREIEAAEKLLAEIAESIGRREAPDIRDVFGRTQPGLQLGVPNGRDGHRLFNVPWTLAKPVIEAHIAQQRATLGALNVKAHVESREHG